MSKFLHVRLTNHDHFYSFNAKWHHEPFKKKRMNHRLVTFMSTNISFNCPEWTSYNPVGLNKQLSSRLLPLVLHYLTKMKPFNLMENIVSVRRGDIVDSLSFLLSKMCFTNIVKACLIAPFYTSVRSCWLKHYNKVEDVKQPTESGVMF